MGQFITLRKGFARWADDVRGATAVIFALCILPLAIIAGVAIDLTRTYDAHNLVRDFSDAAALAGARMLEDATKTDIEIETATAAYFNAALAYSNRTIDCDTPTVIVDRTDDTVRLTADCDLPMVFAGFVKRDETPIQAGSTAQAALTRLDLALMLDVSGSMGDDNKLEDLKAAAKDAIDILITDQTGDRVRIGFNAYASSVNVGSYAGAVMGPAWVPSSTTCISGRTGIAEFTDDAPGAGKWIGDEATECPTTSVVPLSTDRGALKASIDSLTANGWTAGHLGIAWSRYLISPDWAGIWPVASTPLGYTAPKTKKAVILMTDGKFNTEYASGASDPHDQPDESVDRAEATCDALKADGVIVYAVAFQAPTEGQEVLEYCATSTADHYFNATNGAELKAAYEEIAGQLSGVRVAG